MVKTVKEFTCGAACAMGNIYICLLCACGIAVTAYASEPVWAVVEIKDPGFSRAKFNLKFNDEAILFQLNDNLLSSCEELKGKWKASIRGLGIDSSSLNAVIKLPPELEQPGTKKLEITKSGVRKICEENYLSIVLEKKKVYDIFVKEMSNQKAQVFYNYPVSGEKTTNFRIDDVPLDQEVHLQIKLFDIEKEKLKTFFNNNEEVLKYSNCQGDTCSFFYEELISSRNLLVRDTIVPINNSKLIKHLKDNIISNLALNPRSAFRKKRKLMKKVGTLTFTVYIK